MSEIRVGNLVFFENGTGVVIKHARDPEVLVMVSAGPTKDQREQLTVLYRGELVPGGGADGGNTYLIVRGKK